MSKVKAIKNRVCLWLMTLTPDQSYIIGMNLAAVAYLLFGRI